ncbi:uncharacterized protein [Montipora capricornis]|uniref:uncharacterized protein isoform X1 n=1 Tax=Montipora capricornis TaxID=246305 RepID=UPI0035F1DED3
MLRQVLLHRSLFEIFSVFNIGLKKPKARNTVLPSPFTANADFGKDWERPLFMRQRNMIRPTNKYASFDVTTTRNMLNAKTDNFVGNSIESKGVNVHVWRGLCCSKVNSLRQYPLFPALPKESSFRHTINSGPLGTWYGQRIIGYIHPQRTGEYVFYLDAHVSAEFWLSRGKNINDVEIVAKVAKERGKNSFTSLIGQTSRKLYLKKDRKYFFDVLHVMNGGLMRRDHVNITWKIPGSDNFTELNEVFLSPVLNVSKSSYLIHSLLKARSVLDTEVNDADAGEDDEEYEINETPERKNRLSEEFLSYFGEDFDVKSEYNSNYLAHLLDTSEKLLSSLQGCPSEPTNDTVKPMKRFEGVWKTHFSSVFPDDGTKELACIGNKRREDCKGNDVLKEQEVLTILQALTKNINEEYPGKYAFKSIIHVEKSHDATQGNRYLVELVFRDKVRNKFVRLSDFIHTLSTSSLLCKPTTISWQRNVTINVVLTVKNQGEWLQHFINEMSRICAETNDQNVNIIIVDYGNKDLDIDKALKGSLLKSYRILRRSGAFHKTEAIQSAVRTIFDPHSIILLFDLHLLTPKNLFQAVRKHTLEGRRTFNPVLFRLTFCGRPRTKTTQARGFWETFGFGIFSIFKSDWDKFGGMNVEAFQHKWGGEDWDLIDRVLSVGLEVERLRMPGFYHFYHSKKGMWDDSS